MTDEVVTAAMLAIGDELLSGRTKDKNIGHLADILTAVGIDLEEVRIVPDEEDRIVEALNALRERYEYVFTSGGIGPTHDDITADAIAKAFDVPCEHDAAAMKLMGDNYAARGIEFTESRQRMARMPRGSAHIDQSCFDSTWLPYRQCLCDGRRPFGFSGHARQCHSNIESRVRSCCPVQ